MVSIRCTITYFAWRGEILMKGIQVVLVGFHVFLYYAVCNLYHSKVGNVQCASSELCQELLWHPDLLEMHHQQTLSSHFMTTGYYLGIAKGFLVDWGHLFTTSGTQWNHLVTTGRAYLCHVGGIWPILDSGQRHAGLTK